MMQRLCDNIEIVPLDALRSFWHDKLTLKIIKVTFGSKNQVFDKTEELLFQLDIFGLISNFVWLCLTTLVNSLEVSPLFIYYVWVSKTNKKIKPQQFCKYHATFTSLHNT